MYFTILEIRTEYKFLCRIIYEADNRTKLVRMVNIKNKYSVNTNESSLWQKVVISLMQYKENGSQRMKAGGKHTLSNENKHQKIENLVVSSYTITNTN